MRDCRSLSQENAKDEGAKSVISSILAGRGLQSLFLKRFQGWNYHQSKMGKGAQGVHVFLFKQAELYTFFVRGALQSEGNAEASHG